MESTEWESILQFVSDGIANDVPLVVEKLPVERPALHVSQSTLATPQVPTPPASAKGTPDGETEQSLLVSVSTTFFPGADLDASPTDMIILSSDSVFFYVHSHKLLNASSNAFNSLVSKPEKSDIDDPGPIISVPENSTVVNVILHVAYHMSASHYSPSPNTVVEVVNCMQKYGMSPEAYIAPSTPFFQLLLGTAVVSPIDIYTLAAALDLHELAVQTSMQLLSYPLSSLPDEIVMKMGPCYLKRLFFLHLGRIEALKRLLLPPPPPHAPMYGCDTTDQKKITRAWALASAYLAWDAKPDLSIAAIEAALYPLGERLNCEECKRLLRERITHLVIEWSMVKKTI